MAHSHSGMVGNHLSALRQRCPSGEAKELVGMVLVFPTFFAIDN